MIKKIISSEFFRATFWVFLATGALNIGNYIYHLLMGRMLGPEAYGVLESVISVYYLVSIPFIPLTLVIVKFISAYKGKQDRESLSAFFIYMRKKILSYGLIIAFMLLIISPFITSFLHLPNPYFSLLIVFGFLIGVLAVLIKGSLQGLFNFFALFVSNTIEILSKLLIAIVLVYLGFKALGAFIGLIGSFIVGFIVAFYFIRKEKFKSVKSFTEGRQVLKYSIPVFLTSLGLTSLFTTDIILVRNLFPGVESGYYAALSVLGKIIFFATFPVTMVLFPLVSERHAANKRYINLFFIGIALTLGLAGLIVLIYYSLPEIMVTLLFGTSYIRIASLLGIFGIFIAVYSLCSLFANFYLSIHKTIISLFVLGASLLQIVLISFFHKNLLQVIEMSIISVLLLLILLFIYYPFAIKREKQV